MWLMTSLAVGCDLELTATLSTATLSMATLSMATSSIVTLSG
jgi:hypothetical protein